MSDDDKFEGTGKEIGRIDLGPLGEMVFEDDGCNDSDTYINLVHPDGNEFRFGRANPACIVRREQGDTAFVRILDDLNDAVANSTVSAGSFDPPDPPAFVCDGCGRTWARPRNQTPNAATDICPECAD